MFDITNIDLAKQLVDIAIRLILILILMPLHNMAQSYTAKAFGDPRAVRSGYASLDLRHHIDVTGALAMIAFGFSWSRPVPRRFTKDTTRFPRFARVVTTLVGPLVYLIIGILFIVSYRFGNPRVTLAELAFADSFLLKTLISMATCSIVTAVVNLIPFYPFDASQLLPLILPSKVFNRLDTFITKHEGIYSVIVLVVAIPLISLVVPLVGLALMARLDYFIALLFN